MGPASFFSGADPDLHSEARQDRLASGTSRITVRAELVCVFACLKMIPLSFLS